MTASDISFDPNDSNKHLIAPPIANAEQPLKPEDCDEDVVVPRLELGNFHCSPGYVLVELYKVKTRTKSGILKSEQQIANEQYNGVSYEKLPVIVKVSNEMLPTDDYPNPEYRVNDRILARIDQQIIRDYGLLKWEILNSEFVFFPANLIQGVIRL